MTLQKTTHKRSTGRNKKINPTSFRYVFRLNEEENNQFLSLFEQSGMKIKAHFITSLLFNREIKVVKIDKSALDYYTKLTELYVQFRSVGVNYNQIVKILYRNFSEKKAAAYLYKLEKETTQMIAICKQILELSQQIEQKLR
ncbi:hypothetical protein SAMN05444420_1166 [Capnocytophaga granulosa]|uniref:MobA protein n=1 Tax=Capnocytophaga granulosa TaxID=45242 RepID=A0A1H2ZU97_9FLAO|nr:conjugal transfer protein MobA [Capnocytophaga granulosa]EPD26432.1 hypothetical protein HMPREF9331_02495 [Capnocytophaga granulosa ATCC 51502]SDX20906.1 hypothetical protein SAMN05444420_1166 [Capnocytophaga granulosa]SUX23889.1 Uncharacterised protein [Capnocytophaga granulosa]